MDETTDHDLRDQERTRAAGALGAEAKDLLDSLRHWLHEGNAHRVVVRDRTGRTVLDLPVTAGLVAAAVAPIPAAVGAVLAVGDRWTFTVERHDGGPVEITSDASAAATHAGRTTGGGSGTA